MPDLEKEQSLLRLGYSQVAGVDEVGRGPLAGPVLAGAVILDPDIDPSVPWLRLVNDSKKLTHLQRLRANDIIRTKSLTVSLGKCESGEIDYLGISKACKVAMTRAIQGLNVTPDYLLIDYVELAEANIPYTAIPGGDGKSYSIAAASIVAKVARDEMMVAANDTFPGYYFHRHKGYGTARHMEMLNRLGPSPIHRRSFAPVRLSLESIRGS